jgi:OFA family oxalate/formate antiporter-like MFS transporter
LITAPVASRLIQIVGVLPTFAYLGVGYFIMTIIASLFMQNPPEGYQPPGWTPTAKETAQRATHDFVLGEALTHWQWWALWLILFLNTTAGISLISQEGPLFQELTGVTAVVAGGMVGIASLGNGVGRVFWAWISDLIARRATFAVMFILQVLLFWFLPKITMSSMMTIVAFVILMCYGGGFGTMPAFTADYFGPKNVGPIYGLMLTAWSFASVFGPLYIARMRETAGNYAGALHVIAVVMLISILLPIIVRPPQREKSV